MNGIPQGYLTDRVADLLRDAGFANVLVQLGETSRAAPRRTTRCGGSGFPTRVCLTG